jgi:hypothetical protein
VAKRMFFREGTSSVFAELDTRHPLAETISHTQDTSIGKPAQ